jgi:hypothetical protein
MGAPVGNQNAKRAKRWQKAIERALARASNDSTDAGLDQAADKLVAACIAGDQWALKELGDRIDGKSVQVIGGDDENPVLVREIVIRAVDAANDRPSTEGG